MPDLPPIIAEAHGDRIVLDFMRHPKLGRNTEARARIGLLTSLVTIAGVQTEDAHLEVHLRALPRGLFEAATRVGSQVVLPGVRRARLLLPSGRRSRSNAW
jgi:hypothetical protein